MKVNGYNWKKGSYSWIRNGVRYISVVFTWELPEIERQLGWQKTIIGGPAVKLMPDYFNGHKNVEVQDNLPGALQIHNPNATRTSIGCVRHCRFCAVPKTEGKLIELDDWPDKPVLIDNNLLATSASHFNRVINRLEKHHGVDFNQGLDARLLKRHHARRMARLELKKRGVRLALDDMAFSDLWGRALDQLRSAGIAKRNISSYALIGFNSDPSEAWARCEWIERQGVMVLPMWFHPLDALERNCVTEDQRNLDWNDYERRKIMQWFYQHKHAVKRYN